MVVYLIIKVSLQGRDERIKSDKLFQVVLARCHEAEVSRCLAMTRGMS